MPFCSCPDFKRQGYLCKHFFVAIRYLPDISWNNICDSFSKSPFITLDNYVLPKIEIEMPVGVAVETLVIPSPLENENMAQQVNLNTSSEELLEADAENTCEISSGTSGNIPIQNEDGNEKGTIKIKIN